MKFSSINIESATNGNKQESEKVMTRDIAVIGVALKFPFADGIDTLWTNLAEGKDCIIKLPESRKKDAKDILECLDYDLSALDICEAAYIEDIDMFDYNFFRLSPKEAGLIDPNQRLFLETAWEAIENAGYGGNNLAGTKTGVFVGFASDSEYRNLIQITEPDSLSMAIPGNTKALVGGRLSYLLDLKGPNITVDTTCSSSLVAIHMACNALRNNECAMAVAGGIQIHLVQARPAYIGIEATDNRSKTFDDRADGTGTGEGVGVVILKTLSEALKDRDNIYAVIKGSAVNHDGNSIGITAPNALSQEDVIISSWKDAGIDPETVTYIEAHGTGTNLGDPIEIEGISRAFRNFTDKKQFCAVGAIKSNIGHLDYAAGIAGFVKLLASLSNKKIPPSLHFIKPNRSIAFEESPVYVNKRLTEWISDGSPRRCGVSSFGMSGTNCHITVEEAPFPEKTRKPSDKLKVLTLSARSHVSIKGLIVKYDHFLSKNIDIDIDDLCFTANTGRGHYVFRIAIVFTGFEGLKKALESISQNDFNKEGIFVSANIRSKNTGDVTLNTEKKTSTANDRIKKYLSSGKKESGILYDICGLYVSGAEIDWKDFYQDEKRQKITVPTYFFEKNRCWLNMKNKKESRNKREFTLLDKCLVKSDGVEIYSIELDPDRHWILGEHIIAGNCVLVGTGYFEMIMEACGKRFDHKVLLKDVIILSPLIVERGQTAETHLVFRHEKDHIAFHVASRINTGNEKWKRYIEGKIFQAAQINENIDMNLIKEKCKKEKISPDLRSFNDSSMFDLGPRWNCIKNIFIDGNESVSFLEIPDEYKSEMNDYFIYPSIMDNALTTEPLLSKYRKGKVVSSEYFYLPFTYGSITITGNTPGNFMSMVKMKDGNDESDEIKLFDIFFFDESGKVFLKIEDYRLKKTGFNSLQSPTAQKHFYAVNWKENKLSDMTRRNDGGCILILNGSDDTGKKISEKLTKYGYEVILTETGKEYKKNDNTKYTIDINEGFEKMSEGLKNTNISMIINLLSLSGMSRNAEERMKFGIYTLFDLSHNLLKSCAKNLKNFIVISGNANIVTGSEKDIYPENAALFGMAKVINAEFPGFKTKCIDIEPDTDLDVLTDEILIDKDDYQVAFRNSKRYIEEFTFCDLDTIGEEKIELKEEGCYLITGGAGGLGLEIADYLSMKKKVNIALINRSKFPEKEKWDDILKNNGGISDEKIRKIIEIENRGTHVKFISCNVGSKKDMELAVYDLKNEFGKINGIIHCAGVAGNGFLINKDINTFKDVITPKIYGTMILDELTKDDVPDFMILFSSNNSLLGMPGQGDYTAANAYLDAYSAYRNRCGRRTLAINWPPWKETGMAFKNGIIPDTMMKALSTKNGLKIFDLIFNKIADKIITGEINYGIFSGINSSKHMKFKLSDSIMKLIEENGSTKKNGIKNKTHEISSDVLLIGNPDGNYSATERKIALAWKEILGYDELDINTSFFEIGGDSILLSRVYNILEDTFSGKVQLGDLFSYPTISKLAEFIAETGNTKIIKEQIKETDIEKDILKIFDEIESGKMSVEEAGKLIKDL